MKLAFGCLGNIPVCPRFAQPYSLNNSTQSVDGKNLLKTFSVAEHSLNWVKKRANECRQIQQRQQQRQFDCCSYGKNFKTNAQVGRFRTEYFEENLIRLIEHTRNEIRDIETNIDELQEHQGMPYIVARLQELESQLEILRKKGSCVQQKLSPPSSALNLLLALPQTEVTDDLNIVAESLPPIKSHPNSKSVIFSHCWNDKHIVQPVAKLLEDNGVNVLFDKGVNVNPDLYQSIIDDTDIVLAFISDDYAQSQNCNFELMLSEKRGNSIISVYLAYSDLIKRATDTFLTADQYFAIIDHDSGHPTGHASKKYTVNISYTSPPSLGIACPPLPYSNPKHYIDRNNIWYSIDNAFQSENYCVLHGVGGSGKTYTAAKYGYQQIQSGQNVAWLKCDTVAHAKSSYRDSALAVSHNPANIGKLTDVLALSFYQTMNDIAQNDIRCKFLLILDNVDNYVDVENIVTAHTSANCQVLITT
ncbi:hypothetical protein HK100_004713 [Physocladia obscura]|uniref:TIR domain-containing protein n=1 Tax=Physocladia obscura TaxID=109957 RepID=A0AAD5SVA6_9FUNG|nr:hypothetical protein HK100_004713 [Physocladia obscura]